MNVLKSAKGETLLEVVVSVAVFAVTMLMMATMFLGALRTSRENYHTEQKLDQLLNAAAKQENSVETETNIWKFTVDGSRIVEQEVGVMETSLPDSMSVFQFLKK